MNLIVSIGDCNGIGIEVMLKAIKTLSGWLTDEKIKISVSGNIQTIIEYADGIGFRMEIDRNNIIIDKVELPVIECGRFSTVDFGTETKLAGRLAIDSVENATKMIINGKYDALVTMPISKSAVHSAGWEFSGHTEYLADACGTNNHLMILFTGKLRVALATIHVPLKEVPDLIDFNTILNRMKIFYGSLINDFAIEKPKIAVLGLNPHAGENGDIGREEIESIIPAIEEFNKSSELACGPFSADGFFAHRMDREFDGILAMYHDQGLIPMKLLANGGGVNFTAGLPIVRTSPSHGTAFDIAGKGTADEKSALDAIIAAVNIAKNRNKH